MPVDLRIQQANERTLLAWVRTGVGLMAFGFLVERFALWVRFVLPAAGAAGPPSGGEGYAAVGLALVFLGVIANLVATFEYLRLRRRLHAGEDVVTSRVPGPALAIAVAAVGFALGLAAWIGV